MFMHESKAEVLTGHIRLFFPVNIQPDLDIVVLRNGDVPFGGCDGNGFARFGLAKVLGDVDRDYQFLSFKFHLNIFHKKTSLILIRFSFAPLLYEPIGISGMIRPEQQGAIPPGERSPAGHIS
jgi:hypothetical protein